MEGEAKSYESVLRLKVFKTVFYSNRFKPVLVQVFYPICASQSSEVGH